MFIRSSKCTIKFANKGKQDQLDAFIDEYRRVVAIFIDRLWDLKHVPNLLPKDLTQVESWLSARAIQAAGKQASAIVRGTRKKHEQRQWRIAQLQKEGKDARKLQKLTATTAPSKPDPNTICPELDARFVKMDWDNETIYDGWIVLTSLGNKLKLELPIKCHKQFNKWFERGKIKSGVRLSKKGITFMFECEPISTNGTKTVGIDIGIKSVISTSHGQQYGDLTEVNKKLSRCKKGSKGFKRAQEERTNLICQAVNQLQLGDIKEVAVEGLRGIRKGRKSSRFLSHWTYTDIFGKLNRLCEEQNVSVIEKPYSYTSQRCSKCGWTRKKNREGTQFKCSNCGFTCNADLNAALNISLPLPSISKQQRLSRMNLEGFFWDERGVYSPSCSGNSLPSFIQEE